MSLEERLELDIADALRGIDSIESALGGAASSFQSALTDALDVLSNVTVADVDASAVTSSIDEAVAAADVAPVIEADASSVTDTLDAAISEADQIVTVDADTTALVSEIEAAVTDTDVVIEVDADTAAAEEQISQLGEAAGGAEGDLEGVSGAAEALTGAATGSAEGVGSLVSSLASADPRAAAAAGAILATAGAANELFGAAVDANAASEKFDRTLGGLAEQVRQVNVGGLDASLQDLSRTTGASLEGLETAGARIFSLGTNSGTAAPQVADTTEQILALTTRALALNPTLGESDEVAGRLAQALGRGGRASSQFGFNLDANQIQARGAQLAGKDLSDELTTYERIAGGASLVTEQLGGKLGTDVAAGAGQAKTQIAGLQETLAQLLAEAGQPLIDPGLDLLRAAVPVAAELATTISTVATVALPALTAGLENSVAPLKALNEGLSLLTDIAGEAESVIPGLGDGISEVVGALASPVGFVVGQISDSFNELTGNSKEAEEAEKEQAAAVDQLAAAYQNLNAPIAETNRSFIEGKIQSDELERTLAALGITYDQLAGFASNGKAGVKELDDALKANSNTSKVSGDDLDRLRNIVQTSGEEFQKSAQKTLDNAVAQGTLTQAARDNAVSHHELAGGGRDYLGALQELLPEQARAAQGNRDAAGAADEHEQAIKDLDQAIKDLIQTQLSAIGSGLSLEAAQTRSKESAIALRDAQAQLAEKQASGTATADELARASLRVESASRATREAALGEAEAYVKAAADSRGLTVDQLSATEQSKLLTESFAQQAARLSPDDPLRQNIVGYVAQILGIPPEAATAILADPDPAHAAISAVEERLAALEARRYVAHVTAEVSNALGNLSPFMAGGAIGAGEGGFVGEVEPEIFVPRQAGVIGNQAQLQAAFSSEIARQLGELSGRGAGVVQNIAVTEVANDPQATANAVAFRLGEAVPR